MSDDNKVIEPLPTLGEIRTSGLDGGYGVWNGRQWWPMGSLRGAELYRDVLLRNRDKTSNPSVAEQKVTEYFTPSPEQKKCYGRNYRSKR